MTGSRDPSRTRLIVCAFSLVVAFAGLGARAVDLHLFPDERVVSRKARQEEKKLILSPRRGALYDAKGRVMATSMPTPSVYADPSRVSNAALTAKKLGRLLSEQPEKLRKKLAASDRRFVWIARRVDPAIGKKIEQLKLEGIKVSTEWARLYPLKEAAAQVIGAVGDGDKGIEGIERYYDHLLRNDDSVVRAERDGRGRAIFAREVRQLEPEPGGDLYLTIDTVLQHLVEKEISASMEQSGSLSATGVLMNPQSGEVLALATLPRVNPNRLADTDVAKWRNRAVEEVFEPGSTFKIITIAGALESGALTADERVLCKKGSLRVGGRTIVTEKEHEWLNAEGILKYSDNIGAARVALSLGKERMFEWIKKFGFGEKTGVGTPSEVSGLLSRPSKWKDLDLANHGYGQGIGVTAIQMARAVSIVANGGRSVRPYIVDRAEFRDGSQVVIRPTETHRRVLSEKTAARLTSWLESVTEPGGSGSLAAPPSYRVAGKTGTAQKIDSSTGSYSHQRVVSSFVGFAPVSDPKLVFFVAFNEPKKADFGGMLAAPVFRNVMESALSYLGVPADRVAARVSSASVLPQESDLEPVPQLTGVPDLRGLTVREVLREARRLALSVNVIGTGVAVRQSPSPGEEASARSRLDVVFSEESPI